MRGLRPAPAPPQCCSDEDHLCVGPRKTCVGPAQHLTHPQADSEMRGSVGQGRVWGWEGGGEGVEEGRVGVSGC